MTCSIGWLVVAGIGSIVGTWECLAGHWEVAAVCAVFVAVALYRDQDERAHDAHATKEGE